jgi:hypothetical protein
MALSSYNDTKQFLNPLNKKHLVMCLWMQMDVSVYKQLLSTADDSTDSIMQICNKSDAETEAFALLVKTMIDDKK